MKKYYKVKYVGLELEDRTFLIDFQNMLVEERREKDGHWEVADARFNWCEEGENVFDENHQFVESTKCSSEREGD